MTASSNSSSDAAPGPQDNPRVPRLLCLHGGGTNSTIFRLQCRSLIRAFAPHFHLAFVEAPYLCNVPGTDVLSVYSSLGPFKRWLRWLPDHEAAEDDDVVEAIEGSMRVAMQEDDAAGWQGKWMGLLGFSQGSKVAASVLYEMQLQTEEKEIMRTEADIEGFAGVNWRFALLMAGRGPLASLSARTHGSAGMDRPGEMMIPKEPGHWRWNQHRITLPTVQVHGLNDPGLRYHQELFKDFTEPRTAELLEWNGDHRVPIKTADVASIVEATMRAYKKSSEE